MSSTSAPEAPGLSDAEVFGAAPAAPGESFGQRFRTDFVHAARGENLVGAGLRYAENKIVNAINPDLGSYVGIVQKGDEKAYQQQPDASSTSDYAAAALGHVLGGIGSPESAVGGGILAQGGKTLLTRAARAGVVQAGVNTATDVPVQALNIGAGAQDKYDPMQTLLAAPFGFLLGGSLHGGTELASSFRNFLGKSRGVDPATITPDSVTPEDMSSFAGSPDLQAVMAANGITDPKDPRVQQLDQLLSSRRQAEAARVAEPGSKEPTLAADANAAAKIKPLSPEEVKAERDRVAAMQADAAAGVRTPGELPTAGRETPPPIESQVLPVSPKGEVSIPSDAGAQAGVQAAEAAKAGIDANATEAFRLAQIQRAKGEGYAGRRAQDEIAFNDELAYRAQAKTLGQDPALYVEKQLSIPPEQFRALPEEARSRVIDAAQKQEAAVAPTDAVYRTSDNAQSAEPYSPASAPSVRVEGVKGGVQPTRAELNAENQPAYARTASGISDRPFNATDKGLSPEQYTANADRVRAESATLRDQNLADIEARFQERMNARQGPDSRFQDAERAYAGKKADNFSNTPGKQDAEKRWPVDKFGFVSSSKGGPIKFGDQRQAAKWILNKGHKESPDQVFEIENHPSGKGFTVRERDRTPPPGPGSEAPNAAAGAGKRSESNPGDTGPVRELPSPERPGPQEAPAGGSGVGDQRETRPGEPSQAAPADSTPAHETPHGGEEVPKTDQSEAGAPETKGPGADAGRAETTGNAGEPKPEGTVKTVPTTETGNKAQPPAEPSTGRTFYSNPVDPKAVKDLLGAPLARVFQREKAGIMRDVKSLQKMVGNTSSTNRKNAIQSVADFGRIMAYSNRSVMNVIADRYDHIPQVRELSDMLATQPGNGARVIKQTYNEVLDQRPVARLHQVLNILDGKETDDKFMDRLGDILSGRARAKVGSEDAALAGKLRRLLDEEHGYLTKAGVNLGYVRDNYFPRTLNNFAVIDDPKGFQEAAIKVYEKMGITGENAKLAAEEWYHRALGIGQNKFTVGDYGPSNTFTKGRVLPKEADTIMKPFYVTDPIENLAAYFRQTTRRAEFARRFGESGDKADAMFDEMLRQGMKPGDVSLLRQSFDSVTGNMGGRVPDVVRGVTSWIQTMGSLTLLPRAIVSSLAESVAIGVRSGSALDSLHAFYDSWRAAFSSTSLADQRAAAEAIGVVGKAHQQMILAQRFGGGMESKWQSRIMTNFFSRTGLEGLTEGQRIAGTGIAQAYVKRMLDDVAAGHREASARDLLGELGIGEKDIHTLTKWLGEGDVPISKLIGDTPEATMYRAALGRFVDESIQNPKAVDRPIFANHPVGRMMYSIMSFNYAFTRNVLLRTVHQTAKAIDPRSGFSIGDRARLMGVLLPFTMLLGAQMGVSRLREAVYNPDVDAARTPIQKHILDISRSGITGTLDPIVNAIASVKYERDLSNIVVGANLAMFLQGMSKIAGLLPDDWGGKNNPDTNNSEWAATRAAYQMIAIPLAHTALSLAPGGPLLKAGYGTLMAAPYPVGLSTPKTSQDVADYLVGPRTVPPASADTGSPRGSGRGSGRSSGRGKAR